MEYRRRRRSRNTKALAVRSRTGYTSPTFSRQRNESGGALNVILSLLLLGALVYVMIATPVGSWLLAKLLPDRTPDPQLSPATAAPLEANTELPSAGPLQTETVQLPGLALFALQLGVYDSAANAKGLIASLKSLGAAGYGLATEEGVRILAACYTTEAAASSVRDRLKAQGYDCVVFPIRRDGIEIGITAADEQLSAVRTAAQLTSGLIDDLNEEVIRFDTEERSIEYGRAIVGELLNNVRSARAMLAGVRETSGAVALIDNYLMEIEGLASALCSAETANRVEFSGQLKAMQIGAVERYAALLDGLRRLA